MRLVLCYKRKFESILVNISYTLIFLCHQFHPRVVPSLANNTFCGTCWNFLELFDIVLQLFLAFFLILDWSFVSLFSLLGYTFLSLCYVMVKQLSLSSLLSIVWGRVWLLMPILFIFLSGFDAIYYIMWGIGSGFLFTSLLLPLE